MSCNQRRFDAALDGKTRDDAGRPIARESGLVRRIGQKNLAVYREAPRKAQIKAGLDAVDVELMEQIYRIHLIVDYISGMTDEYSLQSYQLIAGLHVNPHRD